MSQSSSNLTCFAADCPDTDLVSELGLDFSSSGWDRPALDATDRQKTKWFARILRMPGMSPDKPSTIGFYSSPILSEQECDRFADQKKYKKLCRLTNEVDTVQHDVRDAVEESRPPRPKGTSVLPFIALAADLTLLKHLSEVVQADQVVGEGKAYP